MSSDNTDRREFLKKGSVAALGMSLPVVQSLAMTSPPRKLRIGIVGGRFGCSFQFHEHPDCIVEAVSDLRPERRERLMKTYNCAKSYHSLEELVKDKKIDAVAIYTEGPNHVKHVLECLNHGKHVLCAVPAFWGSVEEPFYIDDMRLVAGEFNKEKKLKQFLHKIPLLLRRKDVT